MKNKFYQIDQLTQNERYRKQKRTDKLLFGLLIFVLGFVSQQFYSLLLLGSDNMKMFVLLFCFFIMINVFLSFSPVTANMNSWGRMAFIASTNLLIGSAVAVVFFIF